MTTNSQHDKETSSFSRGIFVALILVSLCLAALTYLAQFSEFDPAGLIKGPYFYSAVLLQGIALLLFVLAWFLLLRLSGSARIGLMEASAHIGVTLLGKYLPGKVWGLIGRTYLLKQRDYSNSDAVQLLLADQFLTFYTGLAIGSLALLAVLDQNLIAPGLAAATLMSIAVIYFYPALMLWLTTQLRKVTRRLLATTDSTAANWAFSKSALAVSMSVYFLHWLAISIVLALLYFPVLEAQLWFNTLLLVAAIPLAMLAGFVALWAPAGIGVREGVIVGLLAVNIPLEVAASIAISYRMICILNDLAMGAVALMHYGKSGLHALRQE